MRSFALYDNRSHYQKKASAIDFKDAASLQFGHRDVDFWLFVVKNIWKVPPLNHQQKCLTLFNMGYFNPRPPKVFLTHTLTQGGGGGGRIHSWTATSNEIKFWQCIHMYLRVSQKIFVYVAFVLFTLLPREAMKTEGFFPDFVTLFLNFTIKSLIHGKLVDFFLAVGYPSLAHSKKA